VLIAEYGTEPFGVVTHGTVISLYAAALLGIAPKDLWQRLDMPAYICVSLPEMEVVEIVESIGPDD
jgi:broad specificity phosphatase PhoE